MAQQNSASSRKSSRKTTQHELSPPPFEDIAEVVRRALETNYTESSAAVVECPELRDAPWQLAAAGLSGNECVADIGGQSHLFPRPLFDKQYSLLECAREMGIADGPGMLLGAGAGPFRVIGQNSELASNLSWSGNPDDTGTVTNKTHFVKVNGFATDGTANVELGTTPSTECALMMNLFGSSGAQGPVLKITARARKGSEKSFTDCIRHALHVVYGDERQVSMGGVFLVKTGRALYHVMPDFPPEHLLPFPDRQHVDQWLTYHCFPAPMVCLTVFHSCDAEQLGLRMEHTHCFSPEEGGNQGGHYHHDLSESQEGGVDDIEYEAYLNTAKMLYRIDQPEVKLEKKTSHE